MTHVSSLSQRGRILILTVMVTILCGGATSVASAHNNEVGSVPKDGAVVTEQPGEFSVTTNDELLNVGASLMQISGPAEAPEYYGDGCGRVEEASVETEAQLGAPGTYTVTWQSVSMDSHSISGQFSFDWQPAPDQVLATGSATPPECAGATVVTAMDASGAVPGAAAVAVGEDGVPTIALVGGGVLLVVLGAAAALIARRRRDRAEARSLAFH
ncbi:copper resistance CopC family protein [Cryobacterium sp. PH29-G1]|uniref:copper resistance CopC family protein n=1 Tax=Cryobacterium sp. PH29-G1 TaxID=3046211 RepID=UPI0024B8DF68|nr:copper resistance CopC family protein [Cryobacterium sp. PH29-G1]MDJ0350005.1 copper resistance protein CopC [Cryobacterium sp. PH29-G1]